MVAIYQFPPQRHNTVGDPVDCCTEIVTNPFNNSESVAPVVRCPLEPTVVFWLQALETADTHGFFLPVSVSYRCRLDVVFIAVHQVAPHFEEVVTGVVNTGKRIAVVEPEVAYL